MAQLPQCSQNAKRCASSAVHLPPSLLTPHQGTVSSTDYQGSWEPNRQQWPQVCDRERVNKHAALVCRARHSSWVLNTFSVFSTTVQHIRLFPDGALELGGTKLTCLANVRARVPLSETCCFLPPNCPNGQFQRLPSHIKLKRTQLLSSPLNAMLPPFCLCFAQGYHSCSVLQGNQMVRAWLVSNIAEGTSNGWG